MLEKRSSLTFTSLHDEWHTLPSWVVNPKGHGGVSWADRVLWNRIVIVVSWLVARSSVLTEQDIIALDWGDTSEDLDLGLAEIRNVAHLLVSDILGSERDWSLHGEDGKGLEQVCYQLRPYVHSRFWQTSRMIPNSSKYPPRPSVPNGSLKVI